MSYRTFKPYKPAKKRSTATKILSNTHYVYFIQLSLTLNKKNITVYKVGYSKNVAYRIKRFTDVNSDESVVRGTNITFKDIKLIHLVPFINIDLAKKYESYILNKYRPYKYYGPNVLANGNSELFIRDVWNIERRELPN